MKALLVLLSCLLLSVINAQVIGFKTTLSQNGINYLKVYFLIIDHFLLLLLINNKKDVGMQILQGQLSSLSIPDMSGRSDIFLFFYYYSFFDFFILCVFFLTFTSPR